MVLGLRGWPAGCLRNALILRHRNKQTLSLQTRFRQ